MLGWIGPKRESARTMTRIAAPAIAYALSVFAVGFGLGTLRVLVLAPLIGESAALLAELPVMLAVSVLAARWAVRRWQVARALGPRAAMGATAFALLMVCEAIVSLALFGNTPAEHLARYATPDAWPGLGAQIVFAAIPALLLRLERPGRSR